MREDWTKCLDSWCTSPLFKLNPKYVWKDPYIDGITMIKLLTTHKILKQNCVKKRNWLHQKVMWKNDRIFNTIIFINIKNSRLIALLSWQVQQLLNNFFLGQLGAWSFFRRNRPNGDYGRVWRPILFFGSHFPIWLSWLDYA